MNGVIQYICSLTSQRSIFSLGVYRGGHPWELRLSGYVPVGPLSILHMFDEALSDEIGISRNSSNRREVFGRPAARGGDREEPPVPELEKIVGQEVGDLRHAGAGVGGNPWHEPQCLGLLLPRRKMDGLGLRHPDGPFVSWHFADGGLLNFLERIHGREGVLPVLSALIEDRAYIYKCHADRLLESFRSLVALPATASFNSFARSTSISRRA